MYPIHGAKIQRAEKIRTSGLLSLNLSHGYQQHAVCHQRCHRSTHQELLERLRNLLNESDIYYICARKYNKLHLEVLARYSYFHSNFIQLQSLTIDFEIIVLFWNIF